MPLHCGAFHSATFAAQPRTEVQSARKGLRGTVPAIGRFETRITTIDAASRRGRTEERPMNLMVWLPAMFFLGLASMGLFVAFVSACERI